MKNSRQRCIDCKWCKWCHFALVGYEEDREALYYGVDPYITKRIAEKDKTKFNNYKCFRRKEVE